MEKNLLFKVTYFCKNVDGEELFSQTYYFSDAGQAMKALSRITHWEFNKALGRFLYPDRINLYSHLQMFQEDSGQYIHVRSAIYSYSEGTGNGQRETRENLDSPLFQMINANI